MEEELADNVGTFESPRRTQPSPKIPIRRVIRPPHRTEQVYEEDLRKGKEEEKEEEQPLPPSPPKVSSSSSSSVGFPYLTFVLSLIVLACFSAVAARMFFYQVPLIGAVNGLLGLRPDVFPLWSGPAGRTKSKLVDPSDRELLIDVARSLEYHFERSRSAGVSCLCSHHLRLGTEPIRVCQVGKILMVNPVMIGNGKAEAFYRETSASCKEPVNNKRFTNIVLEWYDPHEQDVLHSKFSNREALCMQLALDEMEGESKHC